MKKKPPDGGGRGVSEKRKWGKGAEKCTQYDYQKYISTHTKGHSETYNTHTHTNTRTKNHLEVALT